MAVRIPSGPAASLPAMNPIWFTVALAAGLLALLLFDLPTIPLSRSLLQKLQAIA